MNVHPDHRASRQSHWEHGIDICEHHVIDMDEVRRQGVEAVVVRAGRGTRQDGRWIEHVRRARGAGLAVGSYWHLYPSRTSPHHQAELWAAAIAGEGDEFPIGHWADVSSADGFTPDELGQYVGSFLRRTDALIGEVAGVCTSRRFWCDRVALPMADRPRWSTDHATPGPGALGVQTRPGDRGGPGKHLVRAGYSRGAAVEPELRLVERGTNESIESWRSRWMRTDEVLLLQQQLNSYGAGIVADGVFGPATEAAVRAWSALRVRDRLETARYPRANGMMIGTS